jgi:hypothetical protein
MVYGTQEREN